MKAERSYPEELLRGIVLGLLLLGAVVNLVAGIRRPLRERALVHQGYYAQAQEAARAVRARIPDGTPLALMVYDGDQVGRMTGAGFAEDYFNWLLYPRVLHRYRVDGDGHVQSGNDADPLEGPALWFRVQGMPELTRPTGRILAQGDSWILTEGVRP